MNRPYTAAGAVGRGGSAFRRCCLSRRQHVTKDVAMKMSPIEPPGRGERAATPASNFLRTGRGSQTGDLSEQAFWKDALKREDTSSANLLTNMLSGNETGLSFLRSSTAGSGEPWVSVGARNSQMTMVLRRLQSQGQLAGPLQLSASNGRLPPPSASRRNLREGVAAAPSLHGQLQEAAPASIPDDFLPQSRPSTAQSRPGSRDSHKTFTEMVTEEQIGPIFDPISPLPPYQSVYSSANLGLPSSTSLGSLGGSRSRPSTAQSTGAGGGMKRSGSILALGSTGVQLARPNTGHVSLADFDARRPRPKPLITDTEGYGTSSHYLTRYAGYCAAPFRATWR